MSTTISYANSPCPATDAVNDIKEWLGDNWDAISQEMSKVSDCRRFAFYATFSGVQGYPVIAWYELYHGQGSWQEPD